MNARRLTIFSVSTVSLSLVVLAWWLTPEVVEQRFAPDGAINDSTRAQIVLFRIGLCVLAVILPVFVLILRRLWGPFLRDLRVSAARPLSRARADLPSARALMGQLPWRRVGILLWLLLPAWYALVELTFYRQWQWPRCFQTELGIMENIIVAFYLIATISALTLFFQRRDTGRSVGLHRWWMLALGLFCLLVALEETNWGQVYFNFETPELIKRVNYQGDFSLHNLRLPGPLPGKQTYWANVLSQWLAVVLAAAPCLLWVSAALRRFVWRWEIPIPPLLAQAYCAAGALMPSEAMAFSKTGLPDSMVLPSEKREFSIALAFVVWLLAERSRQRLYRDIDLLPQVAEQQEQDAKHLEATARVPRQAG